MSIPSAARKYFCQCDEPSQCLSIWAYYLPKRSYRNVTRFWVLEKSELKISTIKWSSTALSFPNALKTWVKPLNMYDCQKYKKACKKLLKTATGVEHTVWWREATLNVICQRNCSVNVRFGASRPARDHLIKNEMARRAFRKFLRHNGSPLSETSLFALISFDAVMTATIDFPTDVISIGTNCDTSNSWRPCLLVGNDRQARTKRGDIILQESIK